MLSLQSITKAFDTKDTPVLSDVTFDLASTKVCAIVGESGSGKTTLLRLIAGFDFPDSGSVVIDGATVSGKDTFVSPEDRNIGFVFQDFSLFPHLTVRQNIAFGIKSRADKTSRVKELLQSVGLVHCESRYPGELSGGEQQRIALARSLAPSPRLLLMDEPFSNLDVHTRSEIRDQVFQVIRDSGLTCVFVTHDLDDAMLYADTIAILNNGVIEQVGSPEILYSKPDSEYVAGLFGRTNVLVPQFLDLLGVQHNNASSFFIRGEDVVCYADERAGCLPARITRRQFLGAEEYVELLVGGIQKLRLTMPSGVLVETDTAFVRIDSSRVLSFM